MHCFSIRVLISVQDVNKGNLLDFIRSNVERNKHIVKYPVNVLELDFKKEVLPKEILQNLAKIRIIIAADSKYVLY